jgi:hypothetical protein
MFTPTQDGFSSSRSSFSDLARNREYMLTLEEENDRWQCKCTQGRNPNPRAAQTT